MSYPKIGDIVRNNSMLPNQPLEHNQYWSRYFIYLGVNGDFVRVLELSGTLQLDNQAYYRKQLRNVDTDDRFDVVGHSKGWEIIKQELMKEYEDKK